MKDKEETNSEAEDGWQHTRMNEEEADEKPKQRGPLSKAAKPLEYKYTNTNI